MNNFFDFKLQIFTFFVGKVIKFPETEIEQYVVILKTWKNFWNILIWLIVAPIKKTPFCHISHNNSSIQKKLLALLVT